MKTRILALVLAMAPLTATVHASNAVIDTLLAQIQNNAANAPALVAQAVSANPGNAAEILQAAYAKSPSMISAIMVAVINAAPAQSPVAIQYAILQIVAAQSLEIAKTQAAALTKTAIETAILTQNTQDEKAKLAAAIAGAAARAIPGGEQAIQDAAALALPSAIQLIRQAIDSGKFFPPARPAIVISPAT